MAIWNNEFFENPRARRYSRPRHASKSYPGNIGPKAFAGDTVIAMLPDGKQVMASVLRGPDTSGQYELSVLQFDREKAGTNLLTCLPDTFQVCRRGPVRVR
ncbi:hypothetical protein A8H39_02030 [Paraburkholderia fungorum]|nr:hypothetical protein A8H39_02030 [Paraburkholderia fungorum]